MKLKPFLLIALGVLTATAALSVKRCPQTPQFCDQCVMAREMVDWRLAGRWKLFETVHTDSTPVSELLQKHQACGEHAHHWSAPVHVADADLETPDAPRIRSLGYLNAPRTVNFLRAVFDYTDKADIVSWHEVAWQPTFASVLEPSLRFARFPENGFATRAEFLSWWAQSSYPLFNHLHELTVAD